MRKDNILLYHTFAILSVLVWGTTYVATKVLINTGLKPVEILLYRFCLAYACLACVSHKRLRADSWKDEALLLCTGLSGGSLYFIAENTALGITLASNVSLLICTAPIFTILLSSVFFGDRLRRKLLYGSMIALVGVAMVVFNGSVILKISPVGDLLTMVAALLWAVYCLLLRRLGKTYPTLFVTRKVFFYALVTLLAYLAFFPTEFHTELLRLPAVYSNLLFLSIIASMGCYLMWNAAVHHLGASVTSNYLYLIPLVTILVAAVWLGEPLTIVALVGTIFIIGGIYIAER